MQRDFDALLLDSQDPSLLQTLCFGDKDTKNMETLSLSTLKHQIISDEVRAFIVVLEEASKLLDLKNVEKKSAGKTYASIPGPFLGVMPPPTKFYRIFWVSLARRILQTNQQRTSS